MKIAVTYDNGNVFQHFGKTENFKVYEVEDNKVVSSEVIGSNGTGHGALAGLLAEQGIDVLICGGIGGGAQNALAEAGVQLCSGAQGNTDEVVEAYLKGELVSAGTTCDHHHHEEGHSCGDHEEGHSCGGTCGGGCGSHKPAFTGPNVGKTCRTHYRGTFNDGTQCVGAEFRVMAQIPDGGRHLPRGQGQKFRLAKPHRTGIGCFTQEHPAQRRFAAGHRAGDADDVAGVGGEVQAGEDGHIAIGKGEIFQWT